MPFEDESEGITETVGTHIAQWVPLGHDVVGASAWPGGRAVLLLAVPVGGRKLHRAGRAVLLAGLGAVLPYASRRDHALAATASCRPPRRSAIRPRYRRGFGRAGGARARLLRSP